MSISGIGSGAGAGFTPPSTSVAAPTIVMDDDWMTAYLTADDYKIASAIQGKTVAPDKNGHLGLIPGELGEIADARRRGAYSSTEYASADIFSGTTDSGADRGRAYIAQRDAELSLGAASPTSVPTAHVDIQANQDADLKYLTADDYKLASAVAGYAVQPDATGHVTSAPGVLWQIAEMRKRGQAIDATADVSAAIINSVHNANASDQQLALEYILARDRTQDVSTASNVDYLA